MKKSKKPVIQGKKRERKAESSNIMLSPSVFLRRSYSMIANQLFCNDIHWPVENTDDSIVDKNNEFIDTKFNDVVAIRTYSGKGKLVLKDKEFILNSGSLIMFTHHQPRKHFTLGDLWEFDWYEFHISNLSFPLETPIIIPVTNKETLCKKQLLSMHKKSPDDYSVQGCFAYLLTIWFSNLNKENTHSASLKQCVAYISTHIQDNPRVEDLAKMYNYSPRYFRKIFTEFYGVPPKEYINNYALDEAAKLLVSTNLSLENIADKVGMNTPYYLSVRFKKKFGVSPLKYKKEHKN